MCQDPSRASPAAGTVDPWADRSAPKRQDEFFHLTARATWGRVLFIGDDDREDFLMLLRRVARRYGWQCLAWCLMSNHYHLVLSTPKPNLGLGMRDLNGTYARRFNERHGRYGSVFAERYSDQVIRSEEHFVQRACAMWR